MKAIRWRCSRFALLSSGWHRPGWAAAVDTDRPSTGPVSPAGTQPMPDIQTIPIECPAPVKVLSYFVDELDNDVLGDMSVLRVIVYGYLALHSRR